MGEEDVLVEVVINGREVLQFYSTPEHYKTLYEDREALFNTVKTAFKDGVLSSEDIKDVEDIQTVNFLSEVATDENVEMTTEDAPEEQEQEYEEYEIIEETEIDNLTSTALPEELIIDVGLSSDERLNLCAHCDYRTYNVGHFKIHLRQHTGESPFQCNFCDYNSKQKSNLKRHMRQHIEGKDHFECKMCNFSCTQEKVFKRHMILHSRSRPLRPCPFCDYFSTSLAHLTVHIRQHTGETPYHCGLCSYKTVQKSNLTRHLKKHRRGRISKADKLRCCVHCSYRTPNPAHLMAHIRAAHTGETPYVCSHCDYKSAQRSNLKRHLRKHTGERPYQCKLCSYSTAYPYVLKKHIENHPSEEEKISCEFCEFVCYSELEFRRHTKLHSGKTIHCCHICGYVSLNVDHLKTHLRRHSMERPFKCHYCNYDSSQKSNLKRHLLQKHSGVGQKDVIKNSNSEEGVLEKRTEILNIDSSNSGTLPEDKLDQNYVSDNGDTLLSCDDDNENHKSTKNVQFESDPSTYVDESTSIAEAAENEDETEGVEVVSEEHVITTTMEEGEYDVMEEDYIEGTVVSTTAGEVVVEHPQKPKNLSFLNKSQAEKLKEFKRLLQQGTQTTQNTAISKRLQVEENPRQTISADYDNISENTESCTEDPSLEEDFQDSTVSHMNESSYKPVSPTKGDSGIGTQSTISSEKNSQHMEEIIPEDSSILIVEHTADGKGMKPYSEADGGLGYEGTDSQSSFHHCELCGFEAATISELKAHIGIHTGETVASTFHCDLCDFKSMRKNDIGRHKTLIHGGTPPRRLSFVCGVCGYRTCSKEEFLDHGDTHKIPTLKCKICEMKFRNQEELNIHNRSHIGEEPFECYHCAYLTARKCFLRKHIRRHAIGTQGGKGPPYQCYTCGFRTYARADFHSHIGKHKTDQAKPNTCPQCRFVTLDERVFMKHLDMHSSYAKVDKCVTNEIDNKSKEQTEKQSVRTNGEIKKERVPLKEWLINVPEREGTRDLKSNVKSDFLVLGDKKKNMLKDDYFSCPPVKRRRRGLKSLKNGAGTSIIESRLSKKFNFNIKNLSSSSKDTESGYSVEFCGEVLKSHGSLRKYTNYAEIINKSEEEVGTILSNIDNEKQLRIVYENLKQNLISLKNADKEKTSPFQFTIYFKEIEESPTDLIDESLSDFDISLSSDDSMDLDNLNELDSDLDLDVSPFNDLSSSTDKTANLHKKTNLETSRKNGSNKSDPSEFIFNLDAADKVKFLQEKIRQRNERMKELRRLKILNVSSRSLKQEVNGIRSTTESVSQPVSVMNVEEGHS